MAVVNLHLRQFTKITILYAYFIVCTLKCIPFVDKDIMSAAFHHKLLYQCHYMIIIVIKLMNIQ